MKTCAYCKRDDLHDEARRCPHCTSWVKLQGVRSFARNAMTTIGVLFTVVFVLALGGCALMN